MNFHGFKVPSAQRSRSACTDMKMQAGPHVDDLLMSNFTWRDIRPKKLDALAPKTYESSRPVEPARSPSEELAAIAKERFELDEKTGRPRKEPHKVYAGVNMSEQAHLWHSATIDSVINMAKARPVHLKSSGSEITFDTIFQLILDKGHEVYVYGGVLRDVFMQGPQVAEDIDASFSCTVQELVGWLAEAGIKEGDYKLKTDEATGLTRWDYISIGSGKAKFSGHPLEADCAGEFTFNCLLFDLRHEVLIDATGWGVRDAVRCELRIPYDGGRRNQWDLWSATCDRLPGMSALRFFNFRSRGYKASAETIAHNVKWLSEDNYKLCFGGRHYKGPPLEKTLRVFLKRKVLKGGGEESEKRLEVFRKTLEADFDQTHEKGRGAAWWTEVVEPVVVELRTDLLSGIERQNTM